MERCVTAAGGLLRGGKCTALQQTELPPRRSRVGSRRSEEEEEEELLVEAGSLAGKQSVLHS